MADIRAQVEELTTLIGDVVELAREDERQPEPTECRLDAIVRQAVDRAQRRAPGLRWNVSLTPGSVRAQPPLLERAVLNVLDNATKWSPPGETVDVILRRFDRWHLDVRDRGPGIATEDLPKVFNRFYRAPAARAMPGSGLGLAIVHQVVTAHGGTVSIGTPAGGGTHVHIELPTVTESEPEDVPTWGGAAPGAPPREGRGGDPTLPDARLPAGGSGSNGDGGTDPAGEPAPPGGPAPA
jgi:two-component system sensor histidine kinase MprB